MYINIITSIYIYYRYTLQSSNDPVVMKKKNIGTNGISKVHVQRQGLRDDARRGVVHLRQEEELTLSPWRRQTLELLVEELSRDFSGICSGFSNLPQVFAWCCKDVHIFCGFLFMILIRFSEFFKELCLPKLVYFIPASLFNDAPMVNTDSQ